jgi:hypothetical protein
MDRAATEGHYLELTMPEPFLFLYFFNSSFGENKCSFKNLQIYTSPATSSGGY